MEEERAGNVTGRRTSDSQAKTQATSNRPPTRFSSLFGASPAARLLFAVQGARTRNHRGISPRYVTRFPPAPRHASASIGPPRVLCMRCCRLACRSLLRPPPAPFHSQLAASSWPGKHISSDPIGTNPAITVRSGMLPARALISQLSRAIGRESAETELRWMKQTLSDPPPGIRPSCRSLEEMDIIFGAVQAEKRRADIEQEERVFAQAQPHDEGSVRSEIEKV